MGNNFTPKAENALNRAVKIAEEMGHTYIGTEHVLFAISEDESCCASVLLKKHKVTSEILYNSIKEYSGVGSTSKLTSKDTTPKCRKLLENSYKIAKKYSSSRIGTEHLLYALIDERECVAAKILTKIEADIVGLKDSTTIFLRASSRGTCFTEPLNESSIPNLLRYGKNISAMAERGELDPVIGRDKETERVIRILSRKSKNNPCLIGEAGVGKTAIVEGLAQRIYEGRVPERLLGKIVITLDLTSMVAGAKYRGDFEERIKNIMSEVSKNKSIILFIDEIHTIVGAGSAEGAIDAANIMKPELSRGEIQLIGATTISEYRKYIEKDGALERRFQPVMVEEPSVEATVDILFGLKDRLEKYHNVIIEDQAIYSAVKLSERFIQDRFLPDKAIDTLDEACALAGVCFVHENAEYDKINIKVRQNGKRTNIFSPSNDNIRQLDLISQSKETFLNDIDSVASIERPRVTEDHVNKIITEITGAGLPCDSRYTKEMLIERLSASVIGQEKAVEKVAEAIIRNLAGINQHNKPRGIFLFVGESGVGKTKLAQSISKELFGNEESMIKYDMSEYSESTAVTKLLGASPGYVGYDDQNTPIERVRKHPYSVILFDEIEKAHPDILSLFLQIFDEGLLTDSLGRKISFRNAYIVMTSNVGSRVLNSEKSSGFISSVDQDINFEKLRDYFRDEFINRIDEVVVFSPLRDSALKEIAKLRIYDLQSRLNDLGIRIEADEEIYELLIKKATISRYGGAREIGRVMMSLIENKIAEMIVDGSIKNGDIVKIIKHNNDIKCIKQIYALNI